MRAAMAAEAAAARPAASGRQQGYGRPKLSGASRAPRTSSISDASTAAPARCATAAAQSSPVRPYSDAATLARSYSADVSPTRPPACPATLSIRFDTAGSELPAASMPRARPALPPPTPLAIRTGTTATFTPSPHRPDGPCVYGQGA